MSSKKIKDLKILKCNNKAEWEAAKYFRQKYFFGPHNLNYGLVVVNKELRISYSVS